MNDKEDTAMATVSGTLGTVLHSASAWHRSLDTLGLLIAPSVKGGLPEILTSLMNAMNDPFHIELCGDSVKAVLVLLLRTGSL